MSKTFIEELKIEGLGVFNKEKTEKFNKNFNLIKDKRENGKTTLIKSMLWNLLDKEFEYLESIAEHKSSYSSLLINNNNISSKIIKNMVGNIECDNEELLEYKQQISKFSDLLFINDINFSTELTPNEILKEYDNININKKIENTIKEYEDLTNELYSNNIEEEYNEKQKIFKIEIESLKELINKNNILKEKMTLLTNEKKEIQNKQIKAEIYEELKNNYHSLISEYNLFKILLKLKLNNVDINDQEVDTTLELKEIVNSTLISMVDKIKEHFSDKVKNINENFLNLFLDIEEYRHILETLNYIEKYNINDIEYFFNNIEKIKSDITQIIEMEEISDNDEEVLSFVEENFDNELKSIINIFNDSYNEILKFIKYLELSISSKTLESMILYYEIESNDYEKLINLNNKYPYFIVYQINNNFKSEVKSSFKNSISLEFNEQFIGSIENILSGYFEHLQKIKIKFLTDEENNIINNNEEFFSKNISIDEIIEYSSKLIKEINSISIKIKDYDSKQETIDQIEDKILYSKEEIKNMNQKYDIYTEDNIIKEIDNIIKNKDKELTEYVKEHYPKIETKQKYNKKIFQIEEEFKTSKDKLTNLGVQLINDYIKNFNKNYSVEIVEDKIYFVDNSNKLPIQIAKKEQKLIYKIALTKYMNEFLGLMNQSVILFIDDIDDLITKSELENIKNTLSKETKLQIIFTERETE